MSAAHAYAQQTLTGVGARLAELTNDVLFDDVWQRPGLTKRDRSLITITALIAHGTPEQLRRHTADALDNGLTRHELEETLLHLAFYLGWPRTTAAAEVIREALATNRVAAPSRPAGPAPSSA